MSAAVTPEISWTPASCRVNQVFVLQAGIVQWHMSSANSYDNIIESPVRYGEPARPGTGGSLIQRPLTPGIIYEVELWRIEDDQSVIVGEYPFLYRPPS